MEAVEARLEMGVHLGGVDVAKGLARIQLCVRDVLDAKPLEVPAPVARCKETRGWAQNDAMHRSVSGPFLAAAGGEVAKLQRDILQRRVFHHGYVLLLAGGRLGGDDGGGRTTGREVLKEALDQLVARLA